MRTWNRFTRAEQRFVIGVFALVACGAILNLAICFWPNPRKPGEVLINAPRIPLAAFAPTEERKMLDINTADMAQLEKLPEIGASRATTILVWRKEQGYFTDVQQLRPLLNINETQMNNIAQFAHAVVPQDAMDRPPTTVPTPKPTPLPITFPININTANAVQLAALKGIGEKRAMDIIHYRAAFGAFRSPQDLTKVKGIGEKTLLNNLSLITVK